MRLAEVRSDEAMVTLDDQEVTRIEHEVTKYSENEGESQDEES